MEREEETLKKGTKKKRDLNHGEKKKKKTKFLKGDLRSKLK